MKTVLFILSIIIIQACTVNRDFQTMKGTEKESGERQSMLYALPLTTFEITIEATKTITKKGIYSDYAQKLLNISNVPLWDSETWALSDVNITPRQEPDPMQYYTITYQVCPYNLDKLIHFSGNGVILDFENAWKNSYQLNLPSIPFNRATDPLLLNEPVKEKVDTFYRTIMTDTSFIRIPVLKKQLEAKTTEDAAKEIAKQILKIRKSKLKILRGEIENYQPDGDAMKFSINELNKMEEIYLSYFIGIQTTEKRKYKLLLTPTKDNLTDIICYLSTDKGFSSQKTGGCKTISYSLAPETTVPSSVIPDISKNILYFRIPAMTTLTIKQNEEVIATQRFPVYQIGSVQGFLFKP